MLKVKVIQTFRNNKNQIVGYRLQDKQGNVKEVLSKDLKLAMRANKIEVTNLTLTRDNRLVSTKEKTQESENTSNGCIITREIIKNLSGKYTNRIISFRQVDEQTKELMVLRAAKNLNWSIVCDKNYTVIINNRDMIWLADCFKIVEANMLFAETTFKKIDLRNVDTSKVTNMSEMFRSCQVNELNLSDLDTSKVTNMSYMFSECMAKNIDLSSFNTHNVKDMNGMFLHCKAEELSLASLDTSNVEDMGQMFIGYRGKQLDLRSFDISKVINTENMFSLCTAEIKVADNKFGEQIMREYEQREK